MSATISVALAATSTSSTKALWYLTRATGLVSLVLLTLVMVLGVAQIERWAPGRWPRFVTTGLHRNLSLLAVVFLGVHIVSSIVDSYAPVNLTAAVVPFTSHYRPVWLGLGALAFDLLLALTVTSLLRQRIAPAWWRGIHWTAYACWPLAFVHGLGTGSDGRVGWVQVVDLACLAAILGALGWRLAAGWRHEPAARLAGALGSALATLLVVGWAAAGPTQAGWARKAGTPRSLLAAGATATTGTTGTGGSNGSTATTGATFQLPRSSAISGTLSQHGEGQHTTVTIDAALTSGPAATVRIVLEGTALDDGGLAMRQGTVTVGPSSKSDLFTGAVTALNGGDVTASLRASSGRTATAVVHLQIDPTSEHVTGTIDVR
jgi:hypothetical protein